MRVLLVSYDFPPVGGMGVQRVAKLARYLPAFGVTPVVLSNAHGLGSVIDPELVRRNDLQDLEVVRLGGERLARLHAAREAGRRAPPAMLAELLWSVLRCGDVYGLWYLSVRRALPALVRDLRIDAVWATVPPASTGFVGREIARLAGVPWVLDIRDSFVTNVDHRQDLVARVQSLVTPRVERSLVLHADRVVAVSQPIVDNLVLRLGESVRDKCRVIANGFDAQDMPAAAPPRNPRLTFLYAGTFAGRRRPGVLVAAVNRAVASGVVDPAALRFDFYGRYAPDVVAEIEALHPAVERVLHGFVPQSRILVAAGQADCALIVTVPGTDGAAHEVMTGKVFEYLGLRKRVLALTDSAPLRALVREARLGDCVDAGNPEAVAAALGVLYAEWRRAGRLDCMPDEAVVARYDRRAQAGVLAELFRQLSVERR